MLGPSLRMRKKLEYPPGVKTLNTSMKATCIAKLHKGQNEKWTAIPRKLMIKCELNSY